MINENITEKLLNSTDFCESLAKENIKNKFNVVRFPLAAPLVCKKKQASRKVKGCNFSFGEKISSMLMATIMIYQDGDTRILSSQLDLLITVYYKKR